LISEKYFVSVSSLQQAFFSFQSLSVDTVDLFVAKAYQRSLSMKVYVGNLMYNMTEKELKSLFTPFGEVLYSRIVTDQYTRQSKNMGYVKMALGEEGKTAVEELNGTTINNRVLIVRKA
jgi:RNA recognition motif-containing protein